MFMLDNYEMLNQQKNKNGKLGALSDLFRDGHGQLVKILNKSVPNDRTYCNI